MSSGRTSFPYEGHPYHQSPLTPSHYGLMYPIYPPSPVSPGRVQNQGQGHHQGQNGTSSNNQSVFGFATIRGTPRARLSNSNNIGTYSTFGRAAGGVVGGAANAKYVVDGLVVNRFQKQPGNRSSLTNSVLSPDFYSKEQQKQSPTPNKHSSAKPTPPQRRDRDQYLSDFEDDEEPLEEAEGTSYTMNHHEGDNVSLRPRKPAPENQRSLLLSEEENRLIFEILGKGRQTLATAVVQLLVPTPDQSRWVLRETGVVCFVRDTMKRSYFIQIYSLAMRQMVFRQEIYNQFDYEMASQVFLTFEGDNFTVGILFADTTEAGNFRHALNGKLEAKRQRRNDRENRRSRHFGDNQVPPPPPIPGGGNGNNNSMHQVHHHHHQSNNNNNHKIGPPSLSQPPPPPQQSSPFPSMSNGGPAQTISTTYTFNAAPPKGGKSSSKGGKDKKKPSLRKEDIGQPMDFRHIQHVGWDPKKGFDLNGVDGNLKLFFQKAGVSSEVLRDEKTRDFIYNFIEQNLGGMDKIKNARPAAPPPPPLGSSNNNMPSPAPPVPTRTASKPAAPPPPPSRPIPPAPYNQTPPPPPMRTTMSTPVERSPVHFTASPSGPARPPPPNFAKNQPSQPPSSGPIPPPPPPPPPMGMGGGPPPPPPPPPPPMAMDNNEGPMISNNNVGNGNPKKGPSSLPPVTDDRSNLLAQIQKGVQLKRVDPTENAPKRTGGLADCLNQIQTGVALKPVSQLPKEPPSLDTMDGLAGALARALADRQKALNPDSSSSDDDDQEEVDDDDWD